MSNIRRGGGSGGGAPAVPTPTPPVVPSADDDPYLNPEFEPSPIPQVNNGGTLEACETNVFALIELTGLKWRCYMTPSSAPRGVHLSQDDVLRAYGKCLQDGITCTWRRKPPTPPNTGMPEQLQIPSFTNHINKELWVFWYANEPEKLAANCSKLEHVTAEDIGDGSSPPITYEIRILYFKAIHTRIEHSLLKSGRVRLGRWFAKPLPARYRARDFTTPRFIEGVSFNFFVHGGNLVCMAVSAERKPALIQLGVRHLETKKRVKVILAPWSLKGEIVPIDEKSDQFLKTQAQQASTLDEFKQFFTFPVPVVEPKKRRRRNIVESDDSDCDLSVVLRKKPEVTTPGESSEESETDESEEEVEWDESDINPDRSPKSSDEEPETETESELDIEEREYRPSKKPMPEMVTVEVAGVRFQWPTALVCLTLEHDMEAMNEPGDKNVHSVHISEEARVDDVRKRNELSLDESWAAAVVQGILQTANIPNKRNPAVPPTPVGEFAAPYAAQADDETKWNNMDPGRTEKCNCPVEHVMKDCHHQDEPIPGWNSKECDEDTSEFFSVMDDCAPNHRQFPSNQKPVGYRRKEETISKPPPMFPKDGTKEKVEAEQEMQDMENPSYARCDNPEEDPIEDQSFHDLEANTDTYDPERFTPIGVLSPCTNACDLPSASAEQEMPEETFAQIFKPGAQSKEPATAPQKDRAADYDYYFNPYMRNEPDFKPYHNRRIGEKRRASYPPPLPLAPQSPEQPGSQETIPATSSPPPELVLPEAAGKLMMSRSVTFPKLKESEEEHLPRTKKLQRKIYEPESEEENTEEEPGESDDESPDDGFAEMSGSFYPCEDFDEEDIGLPTTYEFEKEKTPEEVIYGDHEPMETDGVMDNILSPPASNEQYQPLSLKATGPPSVPDANQIYPTPPSVLEANQFSPAGCPMTLGTHLHAPTVPSQLVAEEHEPMEVDGMHVIEKRTTKNFAALDVEDHLLPDYSKINGYFSKILETITPKNTPQVEKNITTVINRFSLEKKDENTEELLPVDYYKLAKQLANRPQKPSIEVPISAPQTVGSSSNKINMVPLNHENRSQSESSKAYQVSFTVNPNPMMQQHPMGFPYHRPGMPMRPGYGPAGYGGYGSQMGYGGPMGMPNYGMGQSPMGMPGGYPHMASPMYNPMNAMGTMGGMNSGPMSSLSHMPGGMGGPMMGNMGHGPMGGPMMNQMNPMAMGAPMNPYLQQQQMQQRHMMQMQMQQQQQMGPPMPHMGHQMNPWDQPMGMMAPHVSSPVNPMAPHLGMSHPMSQQGGMGGPGLFQNQIPAPQPIQPVQQAPEPRPPSPPVLPTVGYNMTLGHMQMLPLKFRNLPGPRKLSKTLALNERLAPEASSIVLTIILQDTLLDLHYDISFDACPLCSCNVTIRTRELGLYLSPPEVLRRPGHLQMNLPNFSGFYSSQNHQNTCNCGFSAVRHRYLSMYNGLFPEDAMEATGVGPKEAITPALGPYHGYDPKSMSIPRYIMDSTNNTDRAVLNQLRIMCLKNYVGQTINALAMTAEYMEKAFAPEDDRGVPGNNSEFIMSYVDQTELLLLGNSAVDAALIPMRGPDRKDVSYATFFHPWGLQTANELQVGDEDEALIPSVCEKLKPILDESMKIVRETNTLEGPLIWRDLSKKRQQVSTKIEELDVSHSVEPIPLVCASIDRELHHFSPTMLPLWEETGLGPVDAPKDILYLAVIPDNAEVHAQTLKYMENLSSQYERLKFGKHIALCYDEVRDGIIRSGGQRRPGQKYHNINFSWLDILLKEVNDKTLISRLRLFTQQMEDAVTSVLERNDCLFNREEFRRQIAQEYRAKKQKLSSTASACEKKMEQEARDRGELEEEVKKEEVVPVPAVSSPVAKKGGKKEKEPEPAETTPGPSTEKRSSCLEELLNATPDTSVPPANPAALNATVDPPLEPEEIPQDDYVALPHVICIYVVNPFSWDHESRSAVNARIALVAIIRTYNAICARIKQQNRTQLMLELIELKEVTDFNGSIANLVDNNRGFGNPKIQTWKNNRDNDQFLDDHSPSDDVLDHCWSIYTAPRIGTPEVVRAVQARFMTKCGPGYAMFNQINNWQRVMPQMIYNIPSCPYYLVQKPRTELSSNGDKIIYRSPDEYVLFLSYCIVGGDFLVATVTDEHGRINQNVVINMKPNLRQGHQANYRFKNQTQIRDAMSKLMGFVHGIITLDIKSVRLVIGRLGKMGHGEFKAWTSLLSKTNLKKLSNKPKDGCTPCHDTEGAAGMPNIIAACCISFEAEPYVKVFPKLFDPNDKVVKSKNKITTPGDISATHIMVFTVNTTIDTASREESGNEHNDENMEDFGMDFGVELDLGNEFDGIMTEIGGDLDGAGNEAPGRVGSLRSGTIDMSAFDHTGGDSIQNQPLATGFYISTAPAPDLPDWFWSSCPQAKRKLPNHFKASLHINNQNIGLDDDDITTVTEKKTEKPKNEQIDASHPLDSNRTDAVLRYVLETYNQLSWLNIDRVSMDRVSCLPIHVQSLLRLYHAVARVYL